MDAATSRTWAEISLPALEQNYGLVRAALDPGAKMLAVVKADAYGHGMLPVADTLYALGADAFAVATFAEAAALRERLPSPILVLGYTPPELIPDLIAQDITQTVIDLEAAEAFSRAAGGGALRVHAKVDTGMGRLGFQSPAALSQAMSLPGLDFEGVFTHFAAADESWGEEYTLAQARRFASFVAEAEAVSGKVFRERHCANSGGLLNYAERGVCLSAARPGIALYGFAPAPWMDGRGLIPVMELKTRVAQLKTLSPGDKVSYGCTWEAKAPGMAAVLPIGYADGLHRSLSGSLEVLMHGKRVKQIGRICMDMCVVDVTGVPETRPGDVVTVFGRDGAMTAQALAALAGTIPYEILCSVSARVPRVYLEA